MKQEQKFSVPILFHLGIVKGHNSCAFLVCLQIGEQKIARKTKTSEHNQNPKHSPLASRNLSSAYFCDMSCFLILIITFLCIAIHEDLCPHRSRWTVFCLSFSGTFVQNLLSANFFYPMPSSISDHQYLSGETISIFWCNAMDLENGRILLMNSIFRLN